MIHLSIIGGTPEMAEEINASVVNILDDVGIADTIKSGYKAGNNPAITLTIPGIIPNKDTGEMREQIQAMLGKWQVYNYKIIVRRTTPVARSRRPSKNII